MEETGSNTTLLLSSILERENADESYQWMYGRGHWDRHVYDISHPWTEDGFYPSVIIYSIAFIVGVTGNSLVVFATLGDKKSRSVTTSFLVSLAMADLLFLLICVPFDMIRTFTGSWSGGMVMCKLTAFMETLTGMASVLNLTAVSVERYIVIVHPMKSRTWCTVGKTSRILLCVWIAAIIFASPRLYEMITTSSLYYIIETEETTPTPISTIEYLKIVICHDGNMADTKDKAAFAIYMFLVLFLLPTLLMIFCYVKVIWVLWRSTQELARMTSTTAKRSYQTNVNDESKQCLTATTYRAAHVDSHGDRNPLNKAQQDHSAEICQARKQVIKMLVTIITIFLLAWGPKLIYEVLIKFELLHSIASIGFYLKLCFLLLPYIQSAVNPIIYGFMSKNFRRSMRSACRNHCCFNRCQRRDHCADFDLESRTVNGTMSQSVVTTNMSPSLSGGMSKRTEITTDTEM